MHKASAMRRTVLQVGSWPDGINSGFSFMCLVAVYVGTHRELLFRFRL